nr:MAG: hypothetical protein [Aspergillus flavus vivivirus 1]
MYGLTERELDLLEVLMRKGKNGRCPCYDGAPAYLMLFPEENRDMVFERCGRHPRLIEVENMFWTYGLYDTEHVRLVKMGGGISMTEDENGYSHHFVRTVFENQLPVHIQRDLDQVRCLTSVYCCYDDVAPYHEIEGYCYLKLYPRELQADIAREVGAWPTLAELPSGRFPAVAREVLGEVLASGSLVVPALHVESAASGAMDDLARYPATSVVGGTSPPPAVPVRVEVDRIYLNRFDGQHYAMDDEDVALVDTRVEAECHRACAGLTRQIVVDGEYWKFAVEPGATVTSHGFVATPVRPLEVYGRGKFSISVRTKGSVRFQRVDASHVATLPPEMTGVAMAMDLGERRRGPPLLHERGAWRVDVRRRVSELHHDADYVFPPGGYQFVLVCVNANVVVAGFLKVAAGQHVGVRASQLHDETCGIAVGSRVAIGLNDAAMFRLASDKLPVQCRVQIAHSSFDALMRVVGAASREPGEMASVGCDAGRVAAYLVM